jgi:DNA-binding LytR/AlgR family response regulator
MLSIAICDDDKSDAAKIEALIKDYMSLKQMPYQLKRFHSGEELLEAKEVFELLFLDIALGKMNGIQVGKLIRETNHNAKIIYTTSYKQYCKQAVNRVHAFAYLVKPITKDKMDRQLDEILQCIVEEHEKEETVKFEILEITDDGELEVRIKDFEVKDIYYFEYFNRKIKIKLEHEEYFFRDKMKDLADKMQIHNFEICHQCFLINLRHVKKIKGYDVFLNNNDKIPVSQKKSADFRKKLNAFIQSAI